MREKIAFGNCLKYQRIRPPVVNIVTKLEIDTLVAHPTNRKWVITPVINGIGRVNPLVTRLITHLLSGMNHKVSNWEFCLWVCLENSILKFLKSNGLSSSQKLCHLGGIPHFWTRQNKTSPRMDQADSFRRWKNETSTQGTHASTAKRGP
jgi:hypothetical protein